MLLDDVPSHCICIGNIGTSMPSKGNVGNASWTGSPLPPRGSYLSLPSSFLQIWHPGLGLPLLVDLLQPCGQTPAKHPIWAPCLLAHQRLRSSVWASIRFLCRKGR